MKRVLSGSLLLAMLLLVSACKPANQPSDEPAKDSTADSTTSANDSTADVDPRAYLESLPPKRQQILRITQSESLLQTMSGKFKKLAAVFRKEDVKLNEISFEKLDYSGITKQPLLAQFAAADPPKDFFRFVEWPIAEQSEQISLGEIWQPILSSAAFQDAQIGVLKGAFSEDYSQFTTQTKFEGRLVVDGKPCGVKGWQTLTWEEDARDDWKLVAWEQERLKVVWGDQPIFSNVTEQVVANQDTLKQIQRSPHEELVVKRSGEINVKMGIKDIDEDYPWFSDWECTSQYPTASVVDFDGDGDDDLFLTDRWESPVLLRNDGQGAFVDVTEEVGLKLGKFVNCGYFFDYDNDGDADLLVGFSVKPSQFFDNVDGKFVPNETINQVLDDVRMVVAVAATDVNRDGLLDLYLCTYTSPSGKTEDWIKHVARPQDRVPTRLKIERNNRYVDRGGPPNILLMNRGNTFEWAKVGIDLKQFRCSYQASWADIDNDGDQDLYVCNDFSADVFLRNDTPQGSFQPKFVDVTSEIAPTVKMGFGMGSSFGDYDNDGDLDLYVCNMYSKAGNRIIAQLDEVDERLRVSARGNFLYENLNGEFRQVAGEDDDQQHVNVVGWSFGGQFADFDNDGVLDLFVPSGFYSAPDEIKTDLDL